MKSVGPAPIQTAIDGKQVYFSPPWMKWLIAVGIAIDSLLSADFVVDPFSIDGLPAYANNAAAVAAGLQVGRLYRTGADPDIVAVVH